MRAVLCSHAFSSLLNIDVPYAGGFVGWFQIRGGCNGEAKTLQLKLIHPQFPSVEVFAQSKSWHFLKK